MQLVLIACFLQRIALLDINWTNLEQKSGFIAETTFWNYFS